MKNKKKILSVLCAMVFVFTGCAGNTNAGDGISENTAGEKTIVGEIGTEGTLTDNNQATITEEEAKKIALDDAGIAESDVKGLRVERGREDGYYVYEIEFYAGNKEYDYKIDQTTGDIVGKDYEIENDFAH